MSCRSKKRKRRVHNGVNRLAWHTVRRKGGFDALIFDGYMASLEVIAKRYEEAGQTMPAPNAEEARIGYRSTSATAHDLDNPRAELDRYAERISRLVVKGKHDCVIVPGCCLGHAPQAIAERVDVPVIAYDTMPDVPVLVKRPRFQRVTSQDAFEEVFAATGCADPLIAEHPRVAELFRVEKDFASTFMRQHLERQNTIGDKVVSRRGLQMIQRLATDPVLDDVIEELDGKTVVICSKGPSLDVPMVAELQRRGAVIMAAAQACKALNAGGVVPEYIATADPQPAHVDMVGEHGTLLLDSMGDHDHIELTDRLVWFNLRSSHIHQVAWERMGLTYIDDTPAMLTVGSCMVWLAHAMGCRTMLLMGVDTADDVPKGRCLWAMPGFDGAAVYTYSHYYQDNRWIDRWAGKHPEVDIYRMRHGLPMDHVQHLRPGEVIQALPITPGELDWTAWRKDIRFERVDALLQVLDEAKEHVDPWRGKEHLRKIPETLHDAFFGMPVDEGLAMIAAIQIDIGRRLTDANLLAEMC